MKERIRKIRDHFELSQTAFGERLGMSRSMISNLEYGLVTPPDRVVNLICLTYHVNETWLRTGEGKMLDESAPDVIQQLADQYHLSPLARTVLTTYLALDPKSKAAVDEFMATLSSAIERERVEAIKMENADIFDQHSPDVSSTIQDKSAIG